MRLLLVAGAALIAVGGPARARADSLESTYGDATSGRAPLSEIAHRVIITRRGRTVYYRVTRTIANHGDRVDEATLDIDLPGRAVARRLRLRSGRRWVEGQLLTADDAQARYDALTTKGPVGSRGPALLSWSNKGLLALRVFPVPPGGSVTVQYTLVAPLCYRRGQYWAEYPLDALDGGPKPRIAVKKPGRLLSRASLLRRIGGGSAAEQSCELDDQSGGTTFAVFPHKRRFGVSTQLATHVVRDGKGLVGLDIDVTRQLAPLPRRARVVFVVDASHSVGAKGIATQLALVDGYLSHLPDARVKIVVYRRRAKALSRAWLPATLVRSRIAAGRIALAPNNGSHLDRGLRRAAVAIKGVRGPSRIIAFTDSSWRRGFSAALAAQALAAAPRRSVVHIVELGGLDGTWAAERDDDHLLSWVAARHGGMAVNVGNSDKAAWTMLGLVRPIQIDNVSIGPQTGPQLFVDAPSVLTEGESFHRITSAVVPASVMLRGSIWGKTWTRRLTPDRAASRLLPALVFGDAALDDLPGTWLLSLGRAGRVVSPGTSYLAHDPRVAPSSYGDGDSSSASTCSCDMIPGRSRGGVGSIGGVARGRAGDKTRLLMRRLLSPLVDVCALSFGRAVFDVSVAIETDGIEILQVSATGSPTLAMDACIEEAAWNVQLPSVFAVGSREYENRFRRPAP